MSKQMNAPTEYYYSRKEEGTKAKWWDADEDQLHRHIWPLYERMRKHQDFRSTNNLRFARLYCNMDLVGLRAGQYARVNDPRSYMSNRVTYNVVKSCIDSATAKISQKKPRPVYLTENGTWLMQQKAKRLNQFILGTFQQIGTGSGEDKTMYGLGRQCFRDSCIFGTGVTYLAIDEDKGRVIAEPNLCEEILVDETEGIYRKPRSMHRRRYIAREILLDMYPKHSHKIKEIPSVNETRDRYDSVADLVEILESWHLPSGEDAGDGRHAITIPNCDLRVDEYEDDYFPFLIKRWSLRPLGFYGQGLAEELIGIQLEINKLLRSVQISQHLMAVPQIWLEYQSRTLKKQMNNEIGGIRYYLGKPPIAIVPQAMSAEVYQHIERLYQRAYEISGISQLSATSQKPAGLDSGVALREYKDIETERFAVQEDQYEQYYIEAADLIRKMCRKLKEKGKDPVVQFKDGSSMKTIRFSDVDIPDDKVVISASPSALLPKEPAGKLAYVQELVQGGFYDRDEALDLLDFPDVAKINRIKLGSRNTVIKVIETMVEENKPASPEPFMNVEFARQYAQDYYSNGKADGMPEDRLELLRQWMMQCDVLIDRMTAQEQQPLMPTAGQGVVQTGQPAPPPQSELIQNAPIA